jgi:DMATS type aromatic prenyltransferase
MVRFSIEPLPPDEHTSPSNIVAYGLHTLYSLHRGLRAPVSSLSDYLLLEPSLFTKILKNIGNSNVPNGATIVSNIFLGFDLLPCHVQVKAYCVLHSSLGLLETLTLVNRAISPYTVDTATSTLFTYFQTKPAEWYSTYTPKLILIGIDCDGSDMPRIKIYIRYQFTDFDQLVDQLSLSGKIPLSLDYIAALRDLWGRLACKTSTFTRCSHTSGVMVYYEFSATKPLPGVKVYLPVRFMTSSDLLIADAAAEWLGNNYHFLGCRESFVTTISNTWYESCSLLGIA